MTEREIDPLELGIARCDPAELRGGTPEENADAIRDVFAGAAAARATRSCSTRPARSPRPGTPTDLREGLELARDGGRLGRGGGRGSTSSRRSRNAALATRSPRPGLAAIAEFKRRSPSAGDIRPDADAAQLAAGYERAGAAAMSVLVDERFGGTWDDLRAARAATRLPLLAKGFFSTDEHLRTARRQAPTPSCCSSATSTTRRPRR